MIWNIVKFWKRCKFLNIFFLIPVNLYPSVICFYPGKWGDMPKKKTLLFLISIAADFSDRYMYMYE